LAWALTIQSKWQRLKQEVHWPEVTGAQILFSQH